MRKDSVLRTQDDGILSTVSRVCQYSVHLSPCDDAPLSMLVAAETGAKSEAFGRRMMSLNPQVEPPNREDVHQGLITWLFLGSRSPTRPV